MRSKQQPRPSYRWLNKDENDETDEIVHHDVPEQKDILVASGSASPSSSSPLQQNSRETTPTGGLDTIPPLLSAQAAAAVAAVAMLRDRDTQSLSSSHSSPPSIQHTAQLHHQRLLPPYLIDANQDDGEHKLPVALLHNTIDPTDDRGAINNLTAAVALSTAANNMKREMVSPRCNSRDSSIGRCPSDDSTYSGRNSVHNTNAPSPVSVALPPTLSPTAAAALLPSQSAAMAAYLNVAAAAAQQNRLLLGTGLAKSNSPPLGSPSDGDTPVLDFSTKRRPDLDDNTSDSDVINLSKPDNGPLDLSVSRKRSSNVSPPPPPNRKMSRSMDYKPNLSPWMTPMNPYFAAAAAAAAGLSPKSQTNEWNGVGKKLAPSDATKALEKMSELSRLGGVNEITNRSTSNNSSSSGSRHSAWQSHWLNKGADAAKDVFKCVWCKQSFPTLETLTTHMKETQHMGVNMPHNNNQSPHQQQSHHQSHQSAGSGTNTTNKSDLNLLIKETMPLPRKLVRGQDVWLGKGAEQTRQILKCMWCGQSFRSLAEMTSHMQQTQHYTNIISQEQIISWKSSEDGKNGGSGGSGGATNPNATTGACSTVSAVLTCKVCDQAFSSLKDLSNHMVKNAHYKEHIMRSITESGGRRRQTREKRKKSLPVRKLLEIERAQHDFKNGESSPKQIREQPPSTRIKCEKCGDKIDTIAFVDHIRQCVGGSTLGMTQRNILKSVLTPNSIIPPDSLSPLPSSNRDGGRKSIGDDLSSPTLKRVSPSTSDVSSVPSKESAGTGDNKNSASVLNAIEQLIEKSFDTRSRHVTSGYTPSSTPTAGTLGASILKRLGIDESVDYTKPLIDTQTMNMIRGYQQHSANYGRRERSGSESSSISERGSSRLDSLTPDRKHPETITNCSTPCATPEKSINELNQKKFDDDESIDMKIKMEPSEDGDCKKDESLDLSTQSNKIKEESDNELERIKNLTKEHDDGTLMKSPRLSPRVITPTNSITPIASPNSDRSHSTPNTDKKPTSSSSTGGSLGALSSMFENLTNTNANNPIDSNGPVKKTTAHPLAALQKLCDKTENTPGHRNSSTGSNHGHGSNATNNNTTSNAGAILAFSWACNDAVMTSDSIIKCAFCDTPFCSKGAYRHHLSKVHFDKENPSTTQLDPINLKSTHKQLSPPATSQSPKSASSSTSGNGIQPKSPSSGTTVNNQTPFEESPHSKFLKYTELAKQLSSKYV